MSKAVDDVRKGTALDRLGERMKMALLRSSKRTISRMEFVKTDETKFVMWNASWRLVREGIDRARHHGGRAVVVAGCRIVS